MEYGELDTITFGKYKGKTIIYVMDIDPSYLVWASDTIPWFVLKKGILDESINRAFAERMRCYIDREHWYEENY